MSVAWVDASAPLDCEERVPTLLRFRPADLPRAGTRPHPRARVLISLTTLAYVNY